MIRISMFKEVSDDWYGNYRIADDMRHENKKYIEVSTMPLSDGKFRVCAWGNDDFGVEQDFINEADAYKMFLNVASVALLSETWFKKEGFVRA